MALQPGVGVFPKWRSRISAADLDYPRSIGSPLSEQPRTKHQIIQHTISIMNKLEVKGDWNIAKGKLKQKWAKLTDDDLRYMDGQEDELIGRIQKRTGEQREAVEKAVKEALGS